MRLAIVALTLGLAGCISDPAKAPAWFAERSAESDATYPRLRDVPRGTDANTDAAHWAAVEADLKAAGEAMRANPRSQPAAAEDNPSVFLDEAREDLEQARQAHDPN